MDRGLRAQLSPNEIATLRQIAIYAAGHSDLRLADIQQLHVLLLIEMRDGSWRATKMGLRRLAIIQRKISILAPNSDNHV